MTGRYVITTATIPPGTKLFGRDPARIAFAVFVNDTQDWHYLYDELPQAGQTAQNYVTKIYPLETVFFSALEGHDVTKPWYVANGGAGAGWVLVYEEKLAPKTMAKLKEKGIESTQELALLLVGSALLGN